MCICEAKTVEVQCKLFILCCMFVHCFSQILTSNTHMNTLLHRWWAHEHGRKEIVSLLKSAGVSEKLRDKDGITPLELNEDEF